MRVGGGSCYASGLRNILFGPWFCHQNCTRTVTFFEMFCILFEPVGGTTFLDSTASITTKQGIFFSARLWKVTHQHEHAVLVPVNSLWIFVESVERLNDESSFAPPDQFFHCGTRQPVVTTTETFVEKFDNILCHRHCSIKLLHHKVLVQHIIVPPAFARRLFF